MQSSSTHHAQQLLLQDVLPLLVLLVHIVCLVVLPSDCFLALSTCDITDHMLSGRHAPFHGFGLGNVDHGIE